MLNHHLINAQPSPQPLPSINITITNSSNAQPSPQIAPQQHDNNDWSHDNEYRDGGEHYFGNASNDTLEEHERIRSQRYNISREIEEIYREIKCGSNFTTVVRNNIITATIPFTCSSPLTPDNTTALCNTLIQLLIRSTNDPSRLWVCQVIFTSSVLKRLVINNSSGVISATGITNSTDMNMTEPVSIPTETPTNTTPISIPTETPTITPTMPTPVSVPTGTPSKSTPVSTPTSPTHNNAAKIGVSLFGLVMLFLLML
eukprot:TRINITY_DN261_c0_g1_i2.p1 TRINITY_DN261_c0_g1~~TRINITY_DN261_c0_g1_i2.p1  ORF type:complete len:258 (+),score=55.73 TRINITY_DN261_c0_g1_i2:230-1003(+)